MFHYFSPSSIVLTLNTCSLNYLRDQWKQSVEFANSGCIDFLVALSKYLKHVRGGGGFTRLMVHREGQGMTQAVLGGRNVQ